MGRTPKPYKKLLNTNPNLRPFPLPRNMSKIQRRSGIGQAATIASANFALSSSHLINVAVPQFICSSYQSPTFLPEDLIVTEILFRLPAKTLIRFKCVSKLYQSIISHPKFARNYLQQAYDTSPESLGLLGSTLLLQVTNLPRILDVISKNVTDLSKSMDSICYDRHQDQLSISLSFVSLPYDDSHTILGSSNGLILSSSSSSSRPCIKRDLLTCLYVSNPLTKQSVELPQDFNYGAFDYYIATRHDYTATFLTYKVVVTGGLRYPELLTTKVDIFSSDTGSWVRVCASIPEAIFLSRDVAFCHKGVLYWLVVRQGIVITYNPYDSPDRFDSIQLPSGRTKSNPSLIYSGDEERVKYCEIQECESGVDRMLVWRLEDDSISEWLLEGEYRFPSFSYRTMMKHMVALNPWNREVLCFPFVRNKKVTLINTRNGTWKSVDVFTESTEEIHVPVHKLIHLELSPWSSPFYVKFKPARRRRPWYFGVKDLSHELAQRQFQRQHNH